MAEEKRKKMNVDNPIQHPLRGSLITQTDLFLRFTEPIKSIPGRGGRRMGSGGVPEGLEHPPGGDGWVGWCLRVKDCPPEGVEGVRVSGWGGGVPEGP